MKHTNAFRLFVTLLLTYFRCSIQADVISYSQAIQRCSDEKGQDCRYNKNVLSITSYRVTDESDFIDDFTEMKSDIIVVFNSSQDSILEIAKNWDQYYRSYFSGQYVQNRPRG